MMKLLSQAQSKTNRGDITLVEIGNTSYYQRQDGFFRLSDACRQISQNPTNFLR